MRFDTTIPMDGPSGAELEERAASFGRRWLSCETTAEGQFDFEPLRPGEMPLTVHPWNPPQGEPR